MSRRNELERLLSHTLERTDLSIGPKYEGKVRDTYSLSGQRRLLVVTDRISAFDRVLGTIPAKGQVLNRLAYWWFEETKGVVPNHVIELVDPNALLAIECVPFPVEFVVRGYATGTTSTSLWTHYAAGARSFAGHILPEGLRKHQRLEAPLVTPTTKAEKGAHDERTSRDELIDRGVITSADYDRIATMALALFARGQEIAAKRGLLLVDTKYEFGRSADGLIRVMDEIHTPDSSRYWMADSYEERFLGGLDPVSLDKDFVRRALIAQGYAGEGSPPPLSDELRLGAAEKYIELFERMTATTFVIDERSPIERFAALERTLATR